MIFFFILIKRIMWIISNQANINHVYNVWCPNEYYFTDPRVRIEDLNFIKKIISYNSRDLIDLYIKKIKKNADWEKTLREAIDIAVKMKSFNVLEYIIEQKYLFEIDHPDYFCKNLVKSGNIYLLDMFIKSYANDYMDYMEEKNYGGVYDIEAKYEMEFYGDEIEDIQNTLLKYSIKYGDIETYKTVYRGFDIVYSQNLFNKIIKDTIKYRNINLFNYILKNAPSKYINLSDILEYSTYLKCDDIIYSVIKNPRFSSNNCSEKCLKYLVEKRKIFKDNEIFSGAKKMWDIKILISEFSKYINIDKFKEIIKLLDKTTFSTISNRCFLNACKYGNLNIVIFLMDEYNPDKDTKESGLVKAIMNGHYKILKYMMKYTDIDISGFLCRLINSCEDPEYNHEKEKFIIDIINKCKPKNIKRYLNESIVSKCIEYKYFELLRRILSIRDKISCNFDNIVNDILNQQDYNSLEHLTDDDPEFHKHISKEVLLKIVENPDLKEYSKIIDKLLKNPNIVKIVLDNSDIKEYIISKIFELHNDSFLTDIIKISKNYNYSTRKYIVYSASRYGYINTLNTLLGLYPYTCLYGQNNYPIRIAAEYGHLEIIKLLLKDPKVNSRAMNNYAYKIAKKKGYQAICDLLPK